MSLLRFSTAVTQHGKPRNLASAQVYKALLPLAQHAVSVTF